MWRSLIKWVSNIGSGTIHVNSMNITSLWYAWHFAKWWENDWFTGPVFSQKEALTESSRKQPFKITSAIPLLRAEARDWGPKGSASPREFIFPEKVMRLKSLKRNKQGDDMLGDELFRAGGSAGEKARSSPMWPEHGACEKEQARQAVAAGDWGQIYAEPVKERSRRRRLWPGTRVRSKGQGWPRRPVGGDSSSSILGWCKHFNTFLYRCHLDIIIV